MFHLVNQMHHAQDEITLICFSLDQSSHQAPETMPAYALATLIVMTVSAAVGLAWVFKVIREQTGN